MYTVLACPCSRQMLGWEWGGRVPPFPKSKQFCCLPFLNEGFKNWSVSSRDRGQTVPLPS